MLTVGLYAANLPRPRQGLTLKEVVLTLICFLKHDCNYGRCTLPANTTYSTKHEVKIYYEYTQTR